MTLELGVGLPVDAFPHCTDQTVMNPTAGAPQPICGLEATCTDTPLLAPLASCAAVRAAAPAAGTTSTTTPSASADSTVRHNLQLGQCL